MTQHERRLFYRFPARLPVTFEFVGKPSANLRTQTRNVSGCGVLFTSPRPAEIGTLVRIQLALPIGETLDLYGKVVRVEELIADQQFNIGVVFLSVRDEDIRSIELACRMQRQLSGEAGES